MLDPQAPKSVELVTGLLAVGLGIVIAMGYITLVVLGRHRMRRLRLLSTMMIMLSALLLGYDKGDQYYDTKPGWQSVETWFKAHAADPLHAKGIECTLKGVRLHNVLKKPGPVFNEIARISYQLGADYFYRVNDDTELTAPWVDKFVDTLNGFGPPYGVVGPNHSGGASYILTHDFVHRTHMEIFDTYYPSELTDWWLDDWISHVYGPARTKKIISCTAVHHTHAAGTRYVVNHENEAKWTGIMERGKLKIAQYGAKHPPLHAPPRIKHSQAPSEKDATQEPNHRRLCLE